MILAVIYYTIGALVFFGGLATAFSGTPGGSFAGAGLAVAGLVCIGFGEVFSSIAKIAENTKRMAEARPANYAAEFARMSEGTGITNDLLKKLLAAQHAKTEEPKRAPDNTEPLFFYSDAKMQSQGPFRAGQMRAMARDGRIQSDTPVAKAGSDEWRPFGEIAELA